MSSMSAPSRRWPEPAQFNEAVQNLATSVADPELQAGQAELGPLGLPMPYAGNFADVYKVHCPNTGNTWAVKFFKREVRDLARRYQAISDHLADPSYSSQLPFMVDFRYLADGVRIAGAWYPIVKMRWIEGQTLNRFVAQSLAQPQLLDLLLELWIKLAARLRAANIAHADLQHGNVVLVPEAGGKRLLLKLIDYDGMYVPALAGSGSGEVGHSNYQHPQRAATGAFHAELDRFSHLVICTALRCLRVGGLPLWERFNNGENLLFTTQDFAQPGESKLFRELWTLRDEQAHALVGRLLLSAIGTDTDSPAIHEIVRDSSIQPLSSNEEQTIKNILYRRSTSNRPPLFTYDDDDQGTFLVGSFTANRGNPQDEHDVAQEHSVLDALMNYARRRSEHAGSHRPTTANTVVDPATPIDWNGRSFVPIRSGKWESICPVCGAASYTMYARNRCPSCNTQCG